MIDPLWLFAIVIVLILAAFVKWFRWEIKNAIPENKLDVKESRGISTETFIKREKDGIITEDEIRHTAYLIAAADNFVKSPETYWHEAEKSLKG
jgi:ribosome recycling factor